MKHHPAIASLRNDHAPQIAAQEAMVRACKDWRREPEAGAMLEEIERFGAGAPLEKCPTLEEMFTDAGCAARIARSLVGHLTDALRDAPLGHPPMRHGFNGKMSTLLVLARGRAQLLLQAKEPSLAPAPKAGGAVPGRPACSVSFSDGERYEVVIAGRARAGIVRRCEVSVSEVAGSDVRLHEEPIVLEPGACLAFDCRTEALVVEEVRTRLVTLRLECAAADSAPTRQFERATGRLLGQSCGDLETSRREMMIALLGRMERTEAAPDLARVACEHGDLSLRWQALRECLALDTATGFAALSELAARTGDPLAADAGALRAQLIETYPQLRPVEMRPCPA